MRTERTRLRRRPDRGSHERAAIDAILDAGLVAHLGFVDGGMPVVLPTAYARLGDAIVVHGAALGRLLASLCAGQTVCATVTLLDGLVLARTAFHHSMNYRSVVIFGVPREILDPNEKRRALASLLDHVARGRSAEVPPPTDAEIDATRVIALPLDEASAKVRAGPPVDPTRHGPAWAGEVALPVVPQLRRSPDLDPAIPAPPSVVAWHRDAPQPAIHEVPIGPYRVSTDPSRLDVDAAHAFLSRAYWSEGVPREVVARALAGSICAGAYRDGAQVGMARVISDRATFAWLADVYVLPEHRGQGLARAMIALLRDLPELGGLRRWLLGTRDAHRLYAGLGFAPLSTPERFMEILRPPGDDTR